MDRKLSLGFSTCPNDTFIFDAMVHGKIDCEGIEFEVVMADVEELNLRAMNGAIDVTKLSYNAFALLASNYQLLSSGSALGRNNGPILVSKKRYLPEEISNLRIAIPGVNTTANLLLSIAFPNASEKVEMLFSDIENAVLNDEVDAGLLIHENRFTYHLRNLHKVVDFGEYWESEIGTPIPLGGIAVNRNLPLEVRQKMNRIMRRSVEYAFSNPSDSNVYVQKYAQEMDPEVMKSHIGLYVNKFTQDLGDDGENAIRTLYMKAFESNYLKNEVRDDIFVPCDNNSI